MPEWIVDVTDETALQHLEDSLLQDLSGDSPDTLLRVREEIARFGSVKVCVFSNEHPPPHFRVSYQGETANYQISNCSKLNGHLERFDRSISRWYADNKLVLVETWNRNRPTNCPVGPYRLK